LNYLGGGLLGRWTSNSRFRIEGSVRAGRLKTDFHSADYTDVDGTHAAYDFSSNYFAAHAGLGRTWQVNEDDDLDLLARYYWTRQKADRAILSTGEILACEDNDSHRLRLGGRYTHKDAKARLWYAGAAYEHEFDNRPIALNADGGAISGASLRGGTGIGEIGLIIRSRPDSPLSLEAGLQGYVGRLEGFSGGIRIGYEF
ncbi:MAG: autotransporter outer membrane beta-barrel domain-containing protein, partial [Candidatus Adiutrix sp.]|nr:autotransporter outer membrane beta-barrel domain-containing protein [Candidatus Adiutrix sp.]